MKVSKNMTLSKVFFIILSLLVWYNNADAYIDPNTGGFFLQTVGVWIFIIVSFIPWLWALVDILRNEFAGSNKVVWILVIFIPLIGFILYFLIGRKQKIHKKIA